MSRVTVQWERAANGQEHSSVFLDVVDIIRNHDECLRFVCCRSGGERLERIVNLRAVRFITIEASGVGAPGETGGK